MKRSFLDAFKTSLDLENQTQDIAVKMRQAPNENRVREVLHIKNSGYRGLKSEYNEGQDNSVYFLERGTSYLYQEEILRKATQIEEQETEDECEPDRKMDIDEIFYDKIFVDISNVTGTNQSFIENRDNELEPSFHQRKIYRRRIPRITCDQNQEENIENNQTIPEQKVSFAQNHHPPELTESNDHVAVEQAKPNDLFAQLKSLQIMFLEALQIQLIDEKTEKLSAEQKLKFLDVCSQKMIGEVYKEVNQSNKNAMEKLRAKNQIFTKAFKIQKKMTEQTQAKLEVQQTTISAVQQELDKVKKERDELFQRLVALTQAQNKASNQPQVLTRFEDDDTEGGCKPHGFGTYGWDNNIDSF